MSNITTAAELALVLDQAEAASGTGDGATAERLGQAVLASGFATAHDQARASIVIAAAYLQGGSPDAAWSYLQGIDTSGDSALADRASALQQQIEHYNDQLAAGSDGVASDEVGAVMQAAQEALDQRDGGRAEQLLLPAYQSGQLTPQQAGDVAVLLAWAVLWQGRVADAEQYAGYAASQGAAGSPDAQQAVQDARAAETARADGTDATEATAVFEQGRTYFGSGDYTTAASLFASVYESASAPGSLRGRAAANASAAMLSLGDVTAASQWLDAAAAFDVDGAKLQELRTRIERREQALDLVD
jgi:hypothetical protein